MQNLPVIKYLDILLDERRRVLKQSVQFEKVLAHLGIEGNEGADVLAKAGATLPPVPDLDWEALAQKVRDRIEAAPSSQASSSGRAGSVPRTVPSPQKTRAQSATPKQPIATVPRAPAVVKPNPFSAIPNKRPDPLPAAPKKKPSPLPTVASVSSASSTISRQSSGSQAASTTSTSTSGRVPRIPLSLSDVTIHGNLDAKLSQKELEEYAAFVLDDDDFLREAQEAGL